MNFENNMKQVPEAFEKNADDSYAPKIIYRKITVSQNAVLNTKVIGTVNVKMVTKGTYFNASSSKKFLEIMGTRTHVEGDIIPIWNEDWIQTYIVEGNNQENSIWISVLGTLKFDIDAKVAAALNLNTVVVFEVEGEGRTRFQFSRSVSFEREVRSNDY